MCLITVLNIAFVSATVTVVWKLAQEHRSMMTRKDACYLNVQICL